jgi:hypothetical protein
VFSCSLTTLVKCSTLLYIWSEYPLGKFLVRADCSLSSCIDSWPSWFILVSAEGSQRRVVCLWSYYCVVMSVSLAYRHSVLLVNPGCLTILLLHRSYEWVQNLKQFIYFFKIQVLIIVVRAVGSVLIWTLIYDLSST